VEKLKVGELEISNLPISSFDNTIFAELIDGVLSTADLADFLITLDYPDRRILLKPQPSKASCQYHQPICWPAESKSRFASWEISFWLRFPSINSQLRTFFLTRCSYQHAFKTAGCVPGCPRRYAQRQR
jgi:hypothetical protein